MTSMIRWLIESNRLFNVETTVMYPDVNNMPNPFDPSGWASDDDTDNVNVAKANPSGVGFLGKFTVVTGSGGAVPCSADVSNVLTGDKLSLAILVAPETPNRYLRFRLSAQGVYKRQVRFDLDTNEMVYSNSPDVDFKHTVLSDGCTLYECMWPSDGNYTVCNGSVWFVGDTGALDGSSYTRPDIGDSVYMQATFFGKADNWPALVQPVQVC